MKTGKTTRLDQELYNPLLFNETLSEGDFYTDDFESDDLHGFDLNIDEISFEDFAAMEDEGEMDDQPLYLKQDPYMENKGGLSPFAA